MRRLVPILILSLAGCGAGVPIQVRIDTLSIDFELDEAVDAIESGMREAGLISPDAAGLPEVWPDELPDVCWSTLVSSDQAQPLPLDLTPDPDVNRDDAALFQPVNDGTVSRIELDRLIVRVEANTSNFGLPPLELQAADELSPDADDRRAWHTIGRLGGRPLAPGCGAEGDAAPLVAPGELGDVELVMIEGGESFLGNQLMDPECLTRQSDPLKCKELSLRARSRVRLDTSVSKERPHGGMRLRFIVVATFYVDPT